MKQIFSLIKSSFLYLLSSVFYLLFTSPVFADPPGCASSSNGVCNAVSTGLGININTSAGGFVGSFFTILLSLAGGVAVLLIIVSGYNMMMSQGNAEKVKAAQETLTAAIIGLLFMIFSTTILQIIGVNILHIPQFGK